MVSETAGIHRMTSLFTLLRNRCTIRHRRRSLMAALSSWRSRSWLILPYAQTKTADHCAFVMRTDMGTGQAGEYPQDRIAHAENLMKRVTFTRCKWRMEMVNGNGKVLQTLEIWARSCGKYL